MTQHITAEEFGIDDDRGAALLHRILELDEYIRNATAERDALRESIKRELADNPEPVIDYERNITAVLKERRAPASIDLVTMATHPEHERHIIEAARAGVLNAALTPLRALKGKSAWSDAVLSYEMPAGVTYLLEIKKG